MNLSQRDEHLLSMERYKFSHQNIYVLNKLPHKETLTITRIPHIHNTVEYTVNTVREALLEVSLKEKKLPQHKSIFFNGDGCLMGDGCLKGLSHEIDFKNFDKNLQNLT